MEFGKLNDISNINFNLPPTPAFSQKILSAAAQSNQSLEVYIGCTGWANKSWQGTYYPSYARTDDYLKHYAQQFNTVELNATHYQLPSVEMVKSWVKKVENQPFKFAPKMLQSVSHAGELKYAIPTMQHFCENIRYFGQHLGIVFTQLPERVGVAQWADIELYLKQFPKDIPHALEVRHPSFFEPKKNKIADLAQLLADNNCTAVITDVAGRRDVAHTYISNDTVVVRFVGNQNQPSDQKRVVEWVEKLREWATLGLKKVYFFCHQPNNDVAPELVSFLVGEIQQKTNWNVHPPKLWANPNQQFTLF